MLHNFINLNGLYVGKNVGLARHIRSGVKLCSNNERDCVFRCAVSAAHLFNLEELTMKKSLWFALLLGLICMLTLSACDSIMLDGLDFIQEKNDVSPSHNHTLTHNTRAESQCNKIGNIEYWSCSDCGKYFSNSQCSIEITDKSGVILPKVECSYTNCVCKWCGDENHSLTHHARTEAKCNNTGNIEYWSCSDCGKYFSNSQGSSKITDKTSVTLSKVDCSYVNNVCKWCGKSQTSKGLSFTLSPDKTFYSVRVGTCTDTNVVIPGYYNDLPVTISENAFENNKNITSLTVLDGAISIGRYAFFSCSNLKDITLPDSINHIGVFAFSYTAYETNSANWENGIMLYIDNCLISTKLATYYYQVYSIRNGTVCIAEQAFKNCSSVDEITIPDSVRNIGEWAFYGCSNLTNVTIGNGVSCIEYETFYGCKNLKSVTIGKSVTSIGKRAFYNCKNLDEIKYRGSETQWNAILKGIEWDMYYLGSYGAGTVKIDYTITYNYTDE